MDVLRYQLRPALERPVLVAAFRGWNDAAEAATRATAFLRKAWSARSFCTVDPEEFFDFQVNRPRVTLVDGLTRRIDWPETEFAAGRIAGTDRDAVILTGTEPSIRWRTFSEAIISVAREAGVDMVVTLGALLADVPHTRPLRVMGTAADPALIERLGLTASRYEGPTGIVGVLHDACRRAELPSLSLWAAVPHYVSGLPSPKAAMELVMRLGGLLGFGVDTSELENESRDWERRVAAAVEADPEVSALVRMLESRLDDEEGSQEIPSGDALAAEFEKFLERLRDDEP
jgi:proteasome assembly chaperone (PAC2) family protein